MKTVTIATDFYLDTDFKKNGSKNTALISKVGLKVFKQQGYLNNLHNHPHHNGNAINKTARLLKQ